MIIDRRKGCGTTICRRRWAVHMGCKIDGRNLRRERAFLSRGRRDRAQGRKVEVAVERSSTGTSRTRATPPQISWRGVEDGILLGEARRPARRCLVNKMAVSSRLLGSLWERRRVAAAAEEGRRSLLRSTRRPSVWITKAIAAKNSVSIVKKLRGGRLGNSRSIELRWVGFGGGGFKASYQTLPCPLQHSTQDLPKLPPRGAA